MVDAEAEAAAAPLSGNRGVLLGASASAREASIGSAIRLAAEVVVRLSSIVATLWLSRTLGVATFGAFLIALSIGLMIAELCDLGLNAIVVPSIVRSGRNLRLLVLMKGTMTAIVLLLSALLVPLASMISGIAPALLAFCTIHFLGASWIEMAGTSLRALGRRVDEALVLLVFRFTLVGLVIAAPFGANLSGASSAYALAVVPGLVFGGVLLLKGRSAVGAEAMDVQMIARKAVPLGVNGYLAILSTRVELFLLQAFHGPHVVGLFGGALKIVESLLTLPSAIAAGALPSVAKDVLTGSRGAAQRTFGLVVWIGVPSAVGLALCAPGVLSVMGPGFIQASPALRILSAALFLCFVNAALFHVLIAAGDTAVIPRLTLSRVGVALLLGALLVPEYGALGASFSFTAAELFLFGSLVHRARPHAALQVIRPVAWALLASLPMALFLSVWSLSLPLSILGGVGLFALTATVILRRGTEAAGLG